MEIPRQVMDATEITAELTALKAAKDGAYQERDRLVALISKVFPACLARHPDSDTSWDNDWRWIVFVLLPTGQASWHIHDSELAWFKHLPRTGAPEWDGHTTDEKYRRVDAVGAGFFGAHNALPALLDAAEERDALKAKLSETERERDEAVALIDAAKSDVRPESFLENAQALLAKCVAPYSCEQMKVVADAMAQWYRKWELMSEVAMKAREDSDTLKAKLEALVKAMEEVRDDAERGVCPDDIYEFAVEAIAAAKEPTQ